MSESEDYNSSECDDDSYVDNGSYSKYSEDILSDSENENEAENEGENKFDHHKNKNISSNKLSVTKAIMTTHGLNPNIIQNAELKNIDDMFQCAFCERFYLNDMLHEQNKITKCCMHCFFWMNYDTFKKMSPSKFGEGVRPPAKNDEEILIIKSICDYITQCANIHNPELCSRYGDSCFLCDYKKGFITLDVPKIGPIVEEIKKTKTIKKFNYDANGMQLRIPKHLSI